MSTLPTEIDQEVRFRGDVSTTGARLLSEFQGLDGLLAENEELRAKLKESEDTLAAIRAGDVDGLVVGNDIYILDSANAANNRLRNDVLAQMEDAVLAFDANDYIIFMNVAAERHYGAASKDVLGQPRALLYTEEWPEESERQASEESMSTHGVYRAHTIHKCKSGLEMHVESTVSRLRDAAGSGVGYLSVIRDITARIRVEETLHAATLALRDADRRKDEFLATLAHELRNPLAPIRNALQIMKLTNDPAELQNARDIIQRQLGQMVHLVDDLLDVSRISQGKVELRRQRVDVVHAVQNAIETSRPAIDRGRHELSIQLPPLGTLIVDADLTRLCQIVANLLNNAAKYTPAHGKISVSVDQDGTEAVICVRDSGIGISDDMLPRIFEMFAQVDRSIEQSQGGLGIGLALVKRLIEMHGGSVHARSEGPGRGSTFTLRIPLLASAMPELKASSPLQVQSTPQSSCRVLVVDDNVDSADSLSQVLSILGYQTLTANDGERAVERALSFMPNAIFLDLGLPKLNGYEAARRIRQHPAGKDMLIVALSGWGQADDRRKSKEAGFDYHFVKPASVDTILDILNQVPLGARAT